MSREIYNISKSYKTYKRDSNEPIELTNYLKIANGFMKHLYNVLVDKGEVRIPERLGVIKIIGRKTKIRVEDGVIKGLVPDWKSTKELWDRDPESKENKQLVYHFNELTDGIRYKFLWSRRRVLVSNKSLYDLKMTRANKRNLSKLIQEGKEYLIVN